MNRVVPRRVLLSVAVTVAALVTAGFVGQAEETDARLWNFEEDRVGGPPAGFWLGRTGEGRVGRWVVQAEHDAPSGTNALAQVDADTTDYRFPIAVANEPVLRDLRLGVKCKPVSGEVDQACGLVFRYQDEDNYYVTRANALEGNVRLYAVVNGNRRQFAGWNGAVATETWHELMAEAQGDHFVVYWDGQEVLHAQDQTFPNPGKVGVWTKADSVTQFDNLRVEPLEP